MACAGVSPAEITRNKRAKKTKYHSLELTSIGELNGLIFAIKVPPARHPARSFNPPSACPPGGQAD